ncbi:MAG: hypothetical protein RLZZ126_467 [Pseudomonadota bacterium]
MTSTTCTDINLAAVGAAGTLDLNLQRQALVSIPDAAHLNVRCVEGAVWITVDGSAQDVVLEPGDAFRSTGHQRAVIYALKPSRIAVAAPAAAQKPESRRHSAFGWKPRLPLAFSAVWA